MTGTTATSKKPGPPHKGKSGIVVPRASSFLQRLAAWVIWAGFTLMSATLRYRLHDPHGFMTRRDVGQVIYCTWHNRLALSMKLYYAFGRRHHQAPGMAGLVSASRDGALLAAILERFGVQPVRGSSSRRGAQALLELTTWAERGYDLAITPDGPRGPRYVVQAGAISLAQVTGVPILPASYHLRWKIRLKNWDGFQLPLPFSRCDVTAGRLLPVPSGATDAERETLRQQLETELLAISRD